jgi:perosamine synthetase
MNNKLAILGGKKILNKKGPHFSWPIITKKIEDAVIKQLHTSISIYDRSGIIKSFEDDFSKYHDRKHSLLCNSGTTAIHSMYVAANLNKNDEVICPAYTFFATVSPLLFTGAKPILCDCDENGNIDPEEIVKLITHKTKAVVVTHMWGIPCQMDKIVEICKKNELLLLEDCSHAHGARFKGKLVGSFGDLSAWSLQGPKNVTGGEGGILTTNNSDFYYRALLLGHYNKRCKQEIPAENELSKYSTTGMGLKYRAHPLAVSIASLIFKDLDKTLKIRNRYAKKIITELGKVKGLIPPQIADDIQPSWYALIFQYRKGDLNNLSIEKFYEALKAEGLLEADLPKSTAPLNTLELFKNPGFLFQIYKENPFSYKKGDFPKAEAFYENAIKLPVWTQKVDLDIIKKYIVGFKKVLLNYNQIND